MSATRSVFAVLSGLVFAVPTFAAPVHGVITRVDLVKNEMTLEGRGPARGEALTFVLDAKTQVVFGRQPGAVADLAVGRRVRVEYELRDSGRIAAVIHVTGAKPAAPAVPAVPADKGAIAGVLRRVALTDREIVVIGAGAMGNETETTVVVPETARIMKDGKAVTLETLKENDTVSVVAEKRDGRLTATAIQVGPGGAAEKTDVIPKIRIALQIADLLLKQMQKPER